MTFRLTSATAVLLTAFLAQAVPNPLRAALTEEQQRLPLEVDAPDANSAKIVILAGSVSNKPGQHEYFAGCAMLMKCLKQTPGVWPVMAAEGWPKNEAIFKNAKAVVCYMDGAEKLPFLQPERWEILKKLATQGAGFVILHQGVDCPSAQADEFKSWFGAVFQKDIGSRGHWDMKVEPKGTHPILHGVDAFDAPKDGWLFDLHFSDVGITPLVTGAVPDKARTTADAKSHVGRPEVFGWAYERPDGGRSFGFTGCDLHKNWGIDAQRRLVVNGILWTAKIDIPAAGAPIQIEPADLTNNMDKKAPAMILIKKEGATN